jgi:Protein of unknown function (DUF1569)
MPDAKVERRKLDFNSFDEVLADAERLLQSGYEKAGNWDLAQVCGHLAEWLRFPLDGYPSVPLLIAPMIWAVRKLAGRKMRDRILNSGRFQTGGRTLPQTVPPPGGDEAAAVAQLRQTIERFKRHDGPFHPSTLYGQMTRDEWTRLNLIHCAHHLSFLVPRSR